MKPFNRVLLLLTLSFALSGCYVAGKVLVDGEPQRGVTVTMEYEGELLATTTDRKGIYKFNNIDAGSYIVNLDLGDKYTAPIQKRFSKMFDQLNVDHVNFQVDSETQRQIDAGTLVGFKEDNGAFAWLGVPFAAAPVGPLRWQAPQDTVGWSKTLPAAAASQPCVQVADLLSTEPLTQLGGLIGREDCLYLNIWAPSFKDAPKPASGVPVMYWIHGGGNTIGEGSTYNGKILAEKYNTVVVTINYRLGALGWFQHPALSDGQDDANASGNFGTLDIIHGLQWVQDNIAAFGGDPSRVLVFGESAGATDTLTVLASPLAEGLVHRAVIQSGGLNWSTEVEAQNYIEDGGAELSSREVVNRLLMADGAADRVTAKAQQESMSAAEIRAYLYGKTSSEIFSVYEAGFGGMIRMPLLIRDGHVLPDQEPLSVFAQGNYHQVPTMLGTNLEETKLFTVLSPEFSNTVFNLLPFVKDEDYFQLNANYTSKAWKLRGVDDIAREMVKHQPRDIYAYRFDWREEASVLFLDLGFLLGAAHGFEIGFAFGDAESFMVQALTPFIYNNDNLAGREYLAQHMGDYWSQLAYAGAPGSGQGNSTPTAWEPWTEGEGESKMIIFDTEAQGGIRMSTEEVTAASLRDELQMETGFPESEQKCKVYLEVVGEDDYYQSECL